MSPGCWPLHGHAKQPRAPHLHGRTRAPLAALADQSRALVLDYYVDDRRAKMDNRRGLAQRPALSESALRNRVHRVRNRLERCVQTCTARAAEIGLEAAVRKPLDVKVNDDE